MTPDELWLHSLCRKNNIHITDIQLSTLTRFMELLTEWNKKINLVSRKNVESLWKNHIALSLTVLFKIEFPPGIRILDFGTGGGFPGIPLAILLPDRKFTLLDSTQKKITAVQAMTESLGLHNVSVVWGRGEELQHTKDLRHSFDAVVARSVSHLTNLMQWAMPFVKNQRGSMTEGEKTVISAPALITFKGNEIGEEEAIAAKTFQNIEFRSIPLIFPGSEEFQNFEKKLVVAKYR